MPADHDLDRLDRSILKILQIDNRTPQREIAERVGLSAPAVQRRIKRMEDTKVIQRNVAIVSPAAVHQEITVIVEVEMNSELGALHDAARSAFLSAKEVQQAYYVTGDVDFILIVVLGTMEEYEMLTRRLFFGNHNVKRFRSYVAMERVKVGLDIDTGA